MCIRDSPTADVEGLDAARKLAILASISFNRRIFFEDVTVEAVSYTHLFNSKD